MNAADVMTGELLSVRPDASVFEAIRVMLDHRISGLPVIDDAGRLIGILTEGDLLRRSETGTERHRPRWLEILMGPGRMAGEYVRTHGRKVGEIMTREVVSVTPESGLNEIVELMERRRIKRVPVLDGDKLVGIVTRADLVRAFVRSDAEIAREIREDVVLRTLWIAPEQVSVSVAHGFVRLSGRVGSESDVELVESLARRVPGVVSVESQLSC